MIEGTPHLTVANPAQAQREGVTVPGMMSWSGTGPACATCHDCRAFRRRSRKEPGVPKDAPREGRCVKYIRTMRGRNGSASIHWIPPETVACRHFEEKPQ